LYLDSIDQHKIQLEHCAHDGQQGDARSIVVRLRYNHVDAAHHLVPPDGLLVVEAWTCVWDVRDVRVGRVGRACGTCVWDVRVGRACASGTRVELECGTRVGTRVGLEWD
jgi:hypothetical protein